MFDKIHKCNVHNFIHLLIYLVARVSFVYLFIELSVGLFIYLKKKTQKKHKHFIQLTLI